MAANLKASHTSGGYVLNCIMQKLFMNKMFQKLYKYETRKHDFEFALWFKEIRRLNCFTWLFYTVSQKKVRIFFSILLRHGEVILKKEAYFFLRHSVE